MPDFFSSCFATKASFPSPLNANRQILFHSWAMRQGNGSAVTKSLPSADTKGRWGSCRPPGAGQGSPQPLHLIPSRAGGQRPRNSQGIPGRRSRLSPAGSAARPLWADDPNRPPPPRRAGRSPRSPARGEEREGEHERPRSGLVGERGRQPPPGSAEGRRRRWWFRTPTNDHGRAPTLTCHRDFALLPLQGLRRAEEAPQQGALQDQHVPAARVPLPTAARDPRADRSYRRPLNPCARTGRREPP